MITAHVPSGYVLYRVRGWSGLVAAAALIGAIFPDFDLFFFYFVDDRAINHHRYWVHAPAFAVVVSLVLIAFAPKRLRAAAVAFGVGWNLHIVLDSVAGGGIMWLWPMSNRLYQMFSVSGVDGQHFAVTQMLHWTFLFEVAIWAAALWAWRKGKQDG